MLTALYVLNALLMIGLPVVLGFYLARRLAVPWRLFFVGAATFILSQVGHIPFNVLVFNGVVLPPGSEWPLPVLALALGLSAGVFEEVARYLVYRFWIKDARTWRQALMFGAGHGGVEAIIFGALAGIGAINIVVLSTVDPGTLGLTPEQAAQVQIDIAAALNAPWYMALLGAAERVFAIIFHISAAVLVLQVFRRRNWLWLVAAILWHTVLNAVSILVLDTAGAVWTEVALAGLSVISLAIIFLLRDPPAAPERAGPLPEPLPEPETGPLAPPPLTPDDLKDTRYQ